MDQASQPISSLQTVKLGDYIKGSSSVKAEMFSQISEDIKMRDILSTLLISMDDGKVLQLQNAMVSGGGKDMDADVMLWDYEEWRTNEIATLSNDYDRRRFTRSTVSDTLSRKVREHSQYSFIARTNIGAYKDRVIKYSFVKICPEARCILVTRQEITKSLEHDIITGGLNREGLLRELTQKIKNCPEDVKYSLLCFNIKNFRIINERHGNKIGDKVLQHMYTSIVYSDLRPISYARYESDNFVCLVNRDTLDTDIISRLCLQECVVDNITVTYRSLCGIFHIEEKSKVSPFDACAHAKLATTFIKDQFITPWIVFEPYMQKTAISDSEILDQIDAAIANEEFEPYYQPVVNLQTGRVEMAEALVRWRSPKHGLVSPAIFIPVLERNGGLSRIDQLMERRVFNLQRKRLKEGNPTIPIDLNLSWSDFADTKLISQLQDHILDDSVPTDLVRFEITESAYEEIADNRLDVLNFFRNHDVKLLVDDFGQGYSFGTMKNVDFHIVKLDKSLIDKLGQSRKMDLLVKTLIGVFHNLNSKVVAEGVEDEKQVKYLKQAGCDYIQGFYYYRPMDEKSFVQLMDDQLKENLMDQKITEITEQISSVLIDRDVLEEQNARLQKSVEEAKCLRMLLDELDIHYFEWDIRTHEDIASEKFCKLYGLQSNVIPNMPEVAPLCLEEDRERFRAFYARAERGEKMGSDCFRLYRPDGNGYTWYRKTFYTIFDQNNMPYKAIITMQDCQDDYRYRMLKARDRMLTQQQEIVTFIYIVANDTISLNYLTKEGEVGTGKVRNFLKTPDDLLRPDQLEIANHLRNVIAEGTRTGFFDFRLAPMNTEYRAHYTMVDGEYGHLYAIIGQAEDINKTRERMEAREQLIHMSEFDSLTQIRNRMSGEREMTKLIELQEPGVFGVLDCDKFKNVNDTFGHVVGDQLLVAIAKTMSEVNLHGINMRLGGDEFAFYVTGYYSKDEIHTVINRFFRLIENLKVPGMEGYPVSVSVGAVINDGISNLDFDQLYRKADVLLYKSKEYEGNKLSL